MSSHWHPPGTPYTTNSSRQGEVTHTTDSPRSTQGIYYPAVYGTPSGSLYSGVDGADGYTFVDQVGQPTTVPVVSRQQVLVSDEAGVCLCWAVGELGMLHQVVRAFIVCSNFKHRQLHDSHPTTAAAAVSPNNRCIAHALTQPCSH